MSSTIATYSFLPWLRQGVANKIATTDLDSSVKLRATIKVDLMVKGEPEGADALETPVTKNISLIGPGDIIGIDQKSIVRVEPRNWITNFEPNYLPHIEFYDEDFPWRYTPAAPNETRDRLRPWITLVILKEGEFEDGKNIKDKPLGYITVQNAKDKFPPADQLWAWAHVHVNEGLISGINAGPGDKAAAISQFESMLTRNPDLACSRLLCPVKLKANTAYHAFLVPTFETGRMAGLGMSMKADEIPAPVHATLSAWEDYAGRPDGTSFPFYFRWHFRTGNVGDFEYLVRLLEPKPVDQRVGRKEIDVQYPGSNLRGITDPDLKGILKLEGALRIPFKTLEPDQKADVLKYNGWDQQNYPHAFQKDLATFINLADSYTEKSSKDVNAATTLDDALKNDCDPLITPPLYGKWHAMTERLLRQRDGSEITPNKNWWHQLNLDPRWRVSAGYGTKVIQDNQENYMSAAWEQVGDIVEANRKLRLGQVAKNVSNSWYELQVQPLFAQSDDHALKFLAPVQKRILVDGRTMFHRIDKSIVSKSVTSTVMRKITRPGGRTMKALQFNNDIKIDNLVARINDNKVVLAPPVKIAAELPSLTKLRDDLLPQNVPAPIINALYKMPWLKWLLVLLLLIGLILLLSGVSVIAGSLLGVVILGLAALFVMSFRWQKEIDDASSVLEENQTPESVDALPMSPSFVLSDTVDDIQPAAGNTDSEEAVSYKKALKDSLGMVQLAKVAGVKQPKEQLDVKNLVATSWRNIDPKLTIPRLIFGSVSIPGRIKDKLSEDFTEAMVYPEIDVPMYKPLTGVSSEHFLPNINYISQNSISLLETNQKFIESYMVGLNHEFARELLWREYPTDQRGSYFRQFWDVNGVFNAEGLSEEALREKLRDIPPIHKWQKSSELGTHDHREKNDEDKEEVVLVIRGELLKRYPNAVIYAQKAKWKLNEDGTVNNTEERELIDIPASEADNPPKNKLQLPLYEAKVDPDIYFFGFDLDVEEVQGSTGENAGDIDKPGWFFCIKERPGETRFGLDINVDSTPNVWNDLSWETLLPGAADGSYIKVDDTIAPIPLEQLASDETEKQEQRNDDVNVSWNKNMNAADIAYIMYQVPVLVAVHGSEMLPKAKFPTN